MPQAPSTFRATHSAGTISSSPVKVQTRKGRGFRVRVKNTGSNPLGISFDSGNTFYTISAGAEFAEDIVFHYFYLIASSGDTTYTALLFEG